MFWSVLGLGFIATVTYVVLSNSKQKNNFTTILIALLMVASSVLLGLATNELEKTITLDNNNYQEDNNSVNDKTNMNEIDDGKLEEETTNALVLVPNVVGMEQMKATELLTSIGVQFQVWWTEENNKNSDKYYVVDQSIPSGSKVPKDSLVKLELSPNKP